MDHWQSRAFHVTPKYYFASYWDYISSRVWKTTRCRTDWRWANRHGDWPKSEPSRSADPATDEIPVAVTRRRPSRCSTWRAVAASRSCSRSCSIISSYTTALPSGSTQPGTRRRGHSPRIAPSRRLLDRIHVVTDLPPIRTPSRVSMLERSQSSTSWNGIASPSRWGGTRSKPGTWRPETGPRPGPRRPSRTGISNPWSSTTIVYTGAIAEISLSARSTSNGRRSLWMTVFELRYIGGRR